MKKKLSNKISIFIMLMVGAIGYGTSNLLVEFFGYGRIHAEDYIKLQQDIQKEYSETTTK